MDSKRIAKLLNRIADVFRAVGAKKNELNKKMEGKYSPGLIALFCTVAAAVLSFCMLFLPNYLGVADDGSVSKVMNACRIYYLLTDAEDIYNNYFVKTYSNIASDGRVQGTYFNSQVLFVKIAVFLDDLFTRDIYFDIRFLGLLYVIFYIPALYSIIKQACIRVKKFSEGSVIGLVGVLIFSDVAYITYFNSFYPEALWMISLMYFVGAAMSFQNKRRMLQDVLQLIVMVVSGIVLLSSRQQTACLGIVFSVFFLKLLFARKNWKWGVVCVLSALSVSILSIACMINLESDFDETSKYHAMTRGVLFESEDPGKTLREFGIEESYEMLTDSSAYDFLPIVKATDPVLQEGFLDNYTKFDIVVYYVQHPKFFLGLMDVAIKSCFGIRREYCGNYEKSVGLPGRARSIFWGMWSTFKNNSAPKTIGFLVILTAAIIMLFAKGYSIRPNRERRSTVFMDMLITVLLICIFTAAVTIVNSGDAEMVQHCFLISYGMDIMIFYVFAELAHKINIF